MLARVTALSAVLLSACMPVSGQSTSTEDFTARARALDGDTMGIDLRLLGVDAPESRQQCQRGNRCYPCGALAQDEAARQLRRGEATIHLTGDKTYGRPVAVVTVGGRDLGEHMIRRGLGVPLTKYLKGDPARAEAYVSAYEDAVAGQVGIHAGTFIRPEDWRKGRRLTCERRRDA